MVFVNVILPVYLIIAISYVLAKFKKLDPFQFSVLSIYILTPALIIRSFDIYGSVLLKSVHLVVIHSLILTVIMYFLSLALAELTKLSKRSKYIFILLSFLPNTGNIGIPVCEYYLGSNGSSFATFILVVTSILSQTYGVYLIMKSKSNDTEVMESIKKIGINILALPLLYVTAFGFLMSLLNLKLPNYIKDPVYGLGYTAIILGLVQLGLVLGKVNFGLVNFKFVFFVNILKLIVSPFLSGIIAYALGFRGTELKVFILQYGMPSALYCSILANFFNSSPRTVAVSVFASTLLSMLTSYGIIELLNLLAL
jgi:predicted permease